MNLTERATKCRNPEVLELNLQSTTGCGAIVELYELLDFEARNGGSDPLSAFLARHAAGAVCLDREIAFPHARLADSDRWLLAVGRSPHGVFFDEWHTGIRLVVLLGSPLQEIEAYLQWASSLVRGLRCPIVRSALLTATDPDAFRAVWLSAISPIPP